MFDCFEMFDKQIRRNGYTMFNDSLAEKFGVTKAVVIMKVHYAIRSVRDEEMSYGGDWHYRNDRWWVERSYESWKQVMPYISDTNLRRTFTALKRDGYLLCTKEYRIDKKNHTLWWSINYEKFLLEMRAFFDVSKMDSSDVSKMTTSINIYNIYIDIEKEYKVKEYKESTHVDQSITLRFLRNLGVLDKSKLLSLLAFNFSVYTSYCGSAHPKLPDTAGTVELLKALLGMIRDNGMDEAMQDYVTFLEADWVNGDKHLWLFCSEKVQAWLTAVKTGDYECWNIATDRVASL